jgi:hypothetical protein
MRFPFFCLWTVVALCGFSPLLCAAQEGIASDEVSYLSFQVPGALGTYPMAINNSMTVTGYYYVSATVTVGFLRDPTGAITTFSIRGGVLDGAGKHQRCRRHYRLLRGCVRNASWLCALRGWASRYGRSYGRV